MTGKWDQTAQYMWEAVLRRVQELKEQGATGQQIADMVGVGNRSIITEWLNGNRQATNASFANMMGYLEGLGLDYMDFMPKPTIRRPGPNAPVESVSGNDLPEIPVMGGTGAGNSVELFSSSPEFMLPVLPRYATLADIGLVVMGDSMSPTIKQGAIVGIAKYDGCINEGGIYLINIPPFGRTMKRIKMGRNGGLILHSDNHNYAPVTLDEPDCGQIILGRVVWIWQEA